MSVAGRPAALAGVLGSVMAVALLPVIVISLLAAPLMRDLGLSRAGLGLLVSLGTCVSALAAPLIGAAADRVSDRAAVAAVLGLGAAVLLLLAVVPNWHWLALALAISGLCQGASNPATNRVIGVRAPAGGRGWLTGVKQSGETIAIVLCAAALPALAIAFGWRGAVVVLCAVAVVALVLSWLAISPGSASASSRGEEAPATPVRASIYWIAAYACAMGAGASSMTTYLPLYAFDVGGLSLAAAGGVMVVAGVVGTCGRVLSAPLAEARMGSGATLVGLAVLAAASSLLLAAVPLLGPGVVWIAAAIWGASGLTFGAVQMLAVIDESDLGSTGRASGLTWLGFATGLAATPPIFGWLADNGPGYTAGLLMVAAFYALGGAVMVVGRRRFRGYGGEAVPGR